MKWKIRLARDMGQEAFVVIAAPTSEEAEPMLWQNMDPDFIHWSDDDVMSDREVREVYPTDDKDELTPLEMPPVRKLKQLIGSPGRTRSRRNSRSAPRAEAVSTRHDRA